VAGTKIFIQRAHRFRKAFGGGMRQAGILAAGALHAVNYHRERLAEDHAKAARLADRLRASDRLKLDDEIQTNIVIVHLRRSSKPAQDIVDTCVRDGILLFAEGVARLRLVTHLDISADAVERAAESILKAVG
jgi:threonine aldolase